MVRDFVHPQYFGRPFGDLNAGTGGFFEAPKAYGPPARDGNPAHVLLRMAEVSDEKARFFAAGPSEMVEVYRSSSREVRIRVPIFCCSLF